MRPARPGTPTGTSITSLAKTETLAGGAEHPVTYGEAVARSYPFHPELVRVLDQRLGDIQLFQRARGALKLLAEVIADIYRDGDDCAVINVADIDYDNPPVLNHLTDGLERGEFAGVARSDFAGPTAHSAMVDAEIFPGKTPLRDACRADCVYPFTGAESDSRRSSQ